MVDDDGDVLEAVAEVARNTGRPVFTARNGREALHLLDTEQIPRPCLIVLDWVMAPVSGEEFLASLGQRSDAAQLPVLVMSAREDVVLTARGVAVVGVLQKPFEVDALLDVLAGRD